MPLRPAPPPKSLMGKTTGTNNFACFSPFSRYRQEDSISQFFRSQLRSSGNAVGVPSQFQICYDLLPSLPGTVPECQDCHLDRYGKEQVLWGEGPRVPKMSRHQGQPQRCNGATWGLLQSKSHFRDSWAFRPKRLLAPSRIDFGRMQEGFAPCNQNIKS